MQRLTHTWSAVSTSTPIAVCILFAPGPCSKGPFFFYFYCSHFPPPLPTSLHPLRRLHPPTHTPVHFVAPATPLPFQVRALTSLPAPPSFFFFFLWLEVSGAASRLQPAHRIGRIVRLSARVSVQEALVQVLGGVTMIDVEHGCVSEL